MRIYATILTLTLSATPTFADTVTLQIENDAGMVTTREGMTQTECEAAALLLNGAQAPQQSGLVVSGPLSPGFCCTMTVPSATKAVATPKLTKAQCMRPTAVKP